MMSHGHFYSLHDPLSHGVVSYRTLLTWTQCPGRFLGIIGRDSIYVGFSSPTSSVWDDPRLLDDGGEIPRFEGRGWRFDSWLWSLLSTWHKNLPGGQLPPVLWRWPVGLLPQKERKKSLTGCMLTVFQCICYWISKWITNVGQSDVNWSLFVLPCSKILQTLYSC